jgi:hypothetical protein
MIGVRDANLKHIMITVSQAYFALHETSPKVQNLWKKKFLLLKLPLRNFQPFPKI